MPRDTQAVIGQWTTDTLHAHVRDLMDERDVRYAERALAQKSATEQALTSASRAVDKAEDIAEKWRLNANEWRAAMSDKDRAYLTKEAAEGKFHAFNKTIADLKERLDRAEGRGIGYSSGWAYFVGAVVCIAAVLSVVAAFMKH